MLWKTRVDVFDAYCKYYFRLFAMLFYTI